MQKIYGYARVSCKDQNQDRQIFALNRFGVDQIFIDRQSGRDFNRPQYKKLLRKLKPDDVLVVKSFGSQSKKISRQQIELHIQNLLNKSFYFLPLPDTSRLFF